MLRVVDLNHWKGAVNLAALQVDAMITKATGGNGYVDDQCDNNVQQAIALNLPWGIFHYFGDGYNDNDPISEANWFINNCLGYLGKGQIWLDWERGGNPNVDRVDMALAWLEHVRITTGFKPAGVYMSTSVVRDYDWSPIVDAGYALWDAEYVEDSTPIPSFQMDPNRDPNPHWDGEVNDVMWQFTSSGRLSGYDGNLDCSFFYGDRNIWHAYINVPTAPAPAPTPDPTPAPLPEPTPTPTPDPVPSPEPTPEPTPSPTPTPAPLPSKPWGKWNWVYNLLKIFGFIK